MSASKQKKVRSETRSEGMDKRQAAQQEAEKASKKLRRNTILAVVVILVVLAAALFINSDYLYTHVAAVQVGDTAYSATEFNYYYRTAYMSFYEQYEDYISFLIDTSSPLDEQVCTMSDEYDYSWADYFTDQAKVTMSRITGLYGEAVAAGYELSEENASSIDTNLAYYEYMAANQNISLDAYLSLSFGKGMNSERYREIMTKYLTAVNYGQTVYDGFSYTQEELDEHYPELADTYDLISYHSYYFAQSDAAYSELADDAKLSAAHDDAAEVAAAATGEEFAAKVYELLPEEEKESFEGVDSTYQSLRGQSLSSANSAVREWLLDPSRKEGDNCVLDTDSGSYALLFVSRDNNDYNTISFRHILVSAEADENGEITQEALDTAKAEIDLLYQMWLADPTEENFATIANNNSDDTGSNTNGGLYETVYKGQLVEELDEYCFGDRQPGDVEIILHEGDSYTGYHLIYFVGEGPNFADYLSESSLRDTAYSDYVNALADSCPATEKFGLRFAYFD